jgi:hypothetical protein
MNDEPTLEQIWEVRRRIDAECGHDPFKLVEYYIKQQRENHERFVKRELQVSGLTTTV